MKFRPWLAQFIACGLSLTAAPLATATNATTANECAAGRVYFTFDTGNHDQAQVIADILQREHITATFFLANEPSRFGYSSLSQATRPYWQALVAQGHEFASHTFNHTYLVKGSADNALLMQPQFGAQAGQKRLWSGAELCDELTAVATQFKALTGQQILPLWRAPGGRVNSASLAAAKACGYAHMGWSPEGLIAEELSPKQFSNTQLRDMAIKRITGALQTGQADVVVLAHLGVWSRPTPWADTVLTPLFQTLKKQGVCFAKLSQHPDLSAKVRKFERQSVYVKF